MGQGFLKGRPWLALAQAKGQAPSARRAAAADDGEDAACATQIHTCGAARAIDAAAASPIVAAARHDRCFIH